MRIIVSEIPVVTLCRYIICKNHNISYAICKAVVISLLQIHIFYYSYTKSSALFIFSSFFDSRRVHGIAVTSYTLMLYLNNPRAYLFTPITILSLNWYAPNFQFPLLLFGISVFICHALAATCIFFYCS